MAMNHETPQLQERISATIGTWQQLRAAAVQLRTDELATPARLEWADALISEADREIAKLEKQLLEEAGRTCEGT